MGHFKVFSLKAQLLCLFIVISQAPAKGNEANTIKGNLPDLSTIFQFLQAFVSPYLRTLGNNTNAPGSNFRTSKETQVERVIREKVEALKPFLQDIDVDTHKDEEDNNLTLEGRDETTIIEFVDNEKTRYNNDAKQKAKLSLKNKMLSEEIIKTKTALKNKIKKYKQIRRNILQALKSEHVSGNTQSLVANTLDEMMAKMIENKCSWPERSDELRTKTKKKIDNSMFLAKEWSEQWSKMKEQYLRHAKKYSTDEPATKLFLLFEQLHEFVSHIMKDVRDFASYKVTCQLSKPDDESGTKATKFNHNYGNDYNINDTLRKGNSTTVHKQKPKCKYFKVCSEELSKYMGNFYVALNDTAVSVLRNYASMYVRDVNIEDSQEQESVITAINNISDLAEYKITKIFIKETTNFKLDENKNVNANIKALKNYVKDTIKKTKMNIESSLKAGLKSLKSKLLQMIKNDLMSNLQVDLDNLVRDLKINICSDFAFCNGKIVGRRYGGDADILANKRNNVYVKVQMSFDDELKKSLGRAMTLPKQASVKTTKRPKKHHRFVKQTRMYRRFNEDQKDVENDGNFHVTRTSLVATSSTTKTNAKLVNSTTTIKPKIETSTNFTDILFIETSNFVSK